MGQPQVSLSDFTANLVYSGKITAEDIQELTPNDLAIDRKLGELTEFPIFVLTLNGTDTKGTSTESMKKKFHNNTLLASAYTEDLPIKSEYSSITKIKLFPASYWIARRGIYAYMAEADYAVYLSEKNEYFIAHQSLSVAGDDGIYDMNPPEPSGIRPVVYLESSAKLTETSTGVWTLDQSK